MSKGEYFWSGHVESMARGEFEGNQALKKAQKVT